MIERSGSDSVISPNICQIDRRLWGSSPAVGSSRKRTCGAWRTPRAISSRRRMPPESFPAIWSRRSQSPTCFRRRSMPEASGRPHRPYIFPWTERFSRAVRFSSVVTACETVPIAARTAVLSETTSCPWMRARPEVGGSSVVSIRIRVVLPAPLGPRSPYVSPAATEKDTASSATKSPNFLVRFSTSMEGIMKGIFSTLSS